MKLKEPQVRSIADHVRPDRQCLLFSATFKKKVERLGRLIYKIIQYFIVFHLARDILTDPIRIVQGEVGEVSFNIHDEISLLSYSIG